MTATPTATPTVDANAARRNLVEVLEFLDRRGASPEAIRMAMVRAGIQPDVSRLLAQCLAPGQQDAAQAVVPKAAPRAIESHPDTAAKALRWLGNTVLIWCLLLGGGFALGFMVGNEIGLAYGIDQGLDRVQEALQGIGEGR